MSPPSYYLSPEPGFHATVSLPGPPSWSLVDSVSWGSPSPLGLSTSKLPFYALSPISCSWKLWISVEGLLGLKLLFPGEGEIPWVSSCTNIKMSSPGLLIYFLSHLQFLQILLLWYETWGTENIFLSMQIYFKLIWRRKGRLPKCWWLIIMSAWAFETWVLQKGSWKWQAEGLHSRISAFFIRPSQTGALHAVQPNWPPKGEKV